MSALQFEVAIVGANGVGKSTYVERHLTGEFRKKYQAFDDTTSVLEYNTSVGRARTVTRTSASVGIINENTDAVMVMFDVTNRLTYKQAVKTLEWVLVNHPGLPVVLVGNKVDVRQRQVKAIDIRPRYNGMKVQYYDVSAKSNYNFEKPILHLLRSNLGMSNLKFIEMDPIDPPEVHITKELMQKMEAELNMEKVWSEINQANSILFDDVEEDMEDEVVITEVRETNAHAMQKEMTNAFAPLTMRCRL